MTNRVHIDAPAGIIEIEGEKDFAEKLLIKMFPLIEGAGFGSHPPSGVAGPTDEIGEPSRFDSTQSEEEGKPKPKRRRGSAPPKGQSCSARILVLKDEGFFGEHRSGVDIVGGLKAKGWTHTSNQVGAALTQMFTRGDIQRTKEGNGSWKYYWDRG